MSTFTLASVAGRRCLLAAVAVAALAVGCAANPPAPEPSQPIAAIPAQPPGFAPVSFASGGAELDAAARSQLRRVASILRSPRWSSLPVEIAGHSDLRGAEEANMRLSLARAEAVAEELEFNNIARERLQVTGYGESQPSQLETTASGAYDREAAAANRRVEIRLVGQP